MEIKRERGTHVLDRVDEGSSQYIENLKASEGVRYSHVLSSAKGGESNEETQKGELGWGNSQTEE